jgi:hypothetical protein
MGRSRGALMRCMGTWKKSFDVKLDFADDGYQIDGDAKQAK